MRRLRPLLLHISALLLFSLNTGTATAAEPASADNPVEFIAHRDIHWVTAKGHPLTTDILVPDTDSGPYPVVIIYHGGGWLINDNSIMDATAEYLAGHGQLVVVNMNYRLLGDNDNSTTMDEIVGDVLGGVRWVKEHIAEYGGDPQRIAVTGDSAGGHLSAMVLLAARNLSSKDFSAQNPAFKPTYLPAGKTPEQIAQSGELNVQAAVLSYGAFDLHQSAKNGFESAGNFFWKMGGAEARGMFGENYNVKDSPQMYKAVSPTYLVPQASERKMPPVFAHVGSKDTTTPPEAVAAFVKKMEAAGQPIEYKVYPGKNHAFLDTGCNEFLRNCFDKDAPDTLDDMIRFLHKSLGAAVQQD